MRTSDGTNFMSQKPDDGKELGVLGSDTGVPSENDAQSRHRELATERQRRCKGVSIFQKVRDFEA